MTTHGRTNSQTGEQITPVSRSRDLLQRKCACGGSAGLSGQCEECGNEQLKVQRSIASQSRPSALTREGLTSRSELLESNTSAFQEEFGHDFGKMSVNSPSPPRLQAKLAISQPGDRFEQEADRVAEQVMRSAQDVELKEDRGSESLPTISRWVGQGDAEQLSRQPVEDEEENIEQFDTANLLSLKEASGSPNAPSAGVVTQVRSMRGGGQSLDPDLRSFFEPRFGHDFSKVRIHTDARAAQTTKALNARAFTLGGDLAFAPGEYQPETPAGRKLIAHELTHVVQQSDQVQTVMRKCDCPAMGATQAPSDLDKFLRSKFPQLKTDDYCVTSAATDKYNCFAWSIGDTSKWLQNEVDTVYGDKNGKLEFSDFDSMYAKHGLKPVVGKTPKNAEVALYAKGSDPTHAARRTGAACGTFESKLGKSVRIAHYPNQLEGGTVYGDINRYYVPVFKP